MNRTSLRRQARTQGFTLVELLVVIAIIGVLAAILIPTFTGAQKKPYDTAAVQCGRAIVTAQAVFKTENRTPAGNINQLGEDVAELCRDVQVFPLDSTGKTAASSGNNLNGIDAAGEISFMVWHQRGSGFYQYYRPANLRFFYVRWP